MPKFALDFGPEASGIPSFTVWRNLDTGEDLLSAAPTLDPLVSGYTTFEISGSTTIQFRAELSGTWVPGVIDPRDAFPSGSGPQSVDHDFGGTDNLRILEKDTLQPIQGAIIYVYLTSDFEAGNLDRQQYLIGWTTTDTQGRWQNPIYLDSGSYTLFIQKGGATAVTKQITVS